jgi:hypothetical protein
MTLLVTDIGFFLTNLIAVAAIVLLASSVQLRGKGYLMSFLVLIVLASIVGYVPSALMRNGAISGDAHRAFLGWAGPVLMAIRVIGWVSLFVFVAGLRVAPPDVLRPASRETGDRAPVASTAMVPDSVRNTMQVLMVVAIVYAIGLLCAIVLLASMGARFLPLLVFAAVAVLYGASIRFAMDRKYGKATGFMIAAGILNLPIGIVAIIVGVVARRAWKKSEEEGHISPEETDRAPIESPVAAGD